MFICAQSMKGLEREWWMLMGSVSNVTQNPALGNHGGGYGAVTWVKDAQAAVIVGQLKNHRGMCRDDAGILIEHRNGRREGGILLLA